MNEISIEDLLEKVKSYNKEALEDVKRAYKYAYYLHDGQVRQSGEPYIIHPLNVAYILAEMHADSNTICAGLLHDTIEDTQTSKEEIARIFNLDIAELVDGVTKISKMNFSTKREQTLANTRKIITSIKKDVRIIMIKLADRLHNMRTLQYKKKEKQQENALETIEIFAPLAYYIGCYKIKNELEDLSLKYLDKEKYKEIEEKRETIEVENNAYLVEMLSTIKDILTERNIPNEIKIRIKSIYEIYKKERKGNDISEIHDLFALKIIVDNIGNCYHTLGLIHSKYHPINSKFKDYICNPKTNKYQSLHTTVFGAGGKIIQNQIRTSEMDSVATNGLATYWDIHKGQARNIMQEELTKKFQFFQSLLDIDKSFLDNQKFVRQIKGELLTSKIYAYTTTGEIIELPQGATPIDFAYYTLDENTANKMITTIVNNHQVPMDYELSNKDRVEIITDNNSTGPSPSWLTNTKTTTARRKIKKYLKV